MKNRRTIRKYKAEDVPANLLNELLNDASRAATMGNMQLYSVVVTRRAEMKAKLAPAHFNQSMVTNAPVMLTFCADFNRFNKWCELRNAVPGYDNLLSFLNATIDTLLFTQNFCTLAEDRGLGTCYLGTTIYNPSQIIEHLNLPKHVIPIAAITVGYPDEHPDQVDRLPISAIVHEEVYTDYTAESIDALYAYKESLEVNNHFVEINKKETLAQVFTDIRYKRTDNERISSAFKQLLRDQGFDTEI